MGSATRETRRRRTPAAAASSARSPTGQRRVLEASGPASWPARRLRRRAPARGCVATGRAWSQSTGLRLSGSRWVASRGRRPQCPRERRAPCRRAHPAEEQPESVDGGVDVVGAARVSQKPWNAKAVVDNGNGVDAQRAGRAEPRDRVGWGSEVVWRGLMHNVAVDIQDAYCCGAGSCLLQVSDVLRKLALAFELNRRVAQFVVEVHV